MSKLEQIETQISSLSAEELAQVRQRFADCNAEAGDRQIEGDLAQGKLGDFIAEAERGCQRRRSRAMMGGARDRTTCLGDVRRSA